MTSAEVVTAVYRALLGHAPDPDGLEFWQSAASVDELIDALTTTERFRQRMAALLAEHDDRAGSAADDLLRGVWRLEHGRGLVELVDLPADVSRHSAFEVLPWAEVLPATPSPTVRVVGAYARQLADELVRRAPGTACLAGLEDAERPVDVLVLTGAGELDVVTWGRPGLVRSVRHRVVLPSVVSARRPTDEVAALRRELRTGLHRLGFVQVTQIVRLRHAETSTVLDVTFATPEGGLRTARRAEDGPRPDPTATWFVAARCADEDDR